MGLLERIRNAIRANLAEVADRVENPERRLEQMVERMEADLAEARLELGAAAREEERLKSEQAAAESERSEMASKARLAVAQGDEELAREALRRSERARERAEGLKHEVTLQTGACRMLREHTQALESKILEARQRLDIARARRRLQEAQQAVSARASRADQELSAILQHRIDELDAAAQAQNEVMSTFRRGAAEDARIDELLEELRRELGDPAPPPDSEGG